MHPLHYIKMDDGKQNENTLEINLCILTFLGVKAQNKASDGHDYNSIGIQQTEKRNFKWIFLFRKIENYLTFVQNQFL